MLHLFRLMPLVLALSFLTATIGFWPGDKTEVVSIQAKFSASPAKLGAALVRLNPLPVKLSTAELEDGPEGEDAPLAIFVRAYDGDDQIQTGFELGFATLDFVAPSDDVSRKPPDLSYYPAYSGFPTGPPRA